ncbi:MAG: hypothetical protein RJA70_3058 [Pseudomonadota bacterium]|jgi:trigger factor
MQVAAEKLSPVLLELAVEVDAERVSSELNKAYREISKSAKISGFRPGKAPIHVLTQMFGPRVARDVAQRLVEETYDQAIVAQNVQVVSQPAIESNPVKANKPFSYKARVEIVPEIPNIKYDGFEVTRPSSVADEMAVDAELQTLRRANSTLEPVTDGRGAAAGDVITIDFDVVVDGATIDEAGSKNLDAELGSGQILNEIEAALLGKKAGETAECDVKLSLDHPNPKLKGKTATFKLSLKEFKARVLPELDDEFAKDLGDYATLSDLKAALKEDIEKRLKETAENGLAEAIVAELVKANPIEVPQSLVQQQSRVTEQEMLAQAKTRGAQSARLPQELRARIHADSEMKVRAGLLMAEIAKRESLKIGDKEIEEGLKELADQSGKNIAKVRAEYREKSKREMLIGMILENKVLDIIQSKSKITDAETPAEDK